MFLFAALVPPRAILDDLWSFVDVTPASEPAAQPPAGRTKSPRLRWRKKTEVAPPPPVLDLAPVAHVNLTLVKFGNLALHDANRLVEAVGVAAAEWSSPRLRFSGYSTAESQDDPTIWVDLDGDLDALNEIGRGIPEVAKSLSLFVDRRLFQPRVRLGSVSPSATEAQLETVLAKLEQFETNAWWQTGIGLYTLADHGLDEPSFKTVADIPLGPHVVH